MENFSAAPRVIRSNQFEIVSSHPCTIEALRSALATLRDSSRSNESSVSLLVNRSLLRIRLACGVELHLCPNLDANDTPPLFDKWQVESASPEGVGIRLTSFKSLSSDAGFTAGCLALRYNGHCLQVEGTSTTHVATHEYTSPHVPREELGMLIQDPLSDAVTLMPGDEAAERLQQVFELLKKLKVDRVSMSLRRSTNQWDKVKLQLLAGDEESAHTFRCCSTVRYIIEQADESAVDEMLPLNANIDKINVKALSRFLPKDSIHNLIVSAGIIAFRAFVDGITLLLCLPVVSEL